MYSMAKANWARSHVLLCALSASLFTYTVSLSSHYRLGSAVRSSSAVARHATGDRAAMAHEAARAYNAATLTITPAYQAKAAATQEWLEDVYDAVDYIAALDAAEELPSPFDDGAIDDESTTYGEFPFSFLAALLDDINPPSNAYFMDLGSGRGQISLAVSRIRAWRGCGGVELLPELHCIAVEAQRVVSSQQLDRNVEPPEANTQSQEGVKSDVTTNVISECEFSFKLGDMYSTDISAIEAPFEKDSSPLVVFVYATCLEVDANGDLQKLTDALADLPKGTTVITVNRPLATHPSDSDSGAESPMFVLLRAFKGPNPEVNGYEQHSTAFIWIKET